MQIRAEHGRVQAIATKAAAQEKGAAATKNAADQGNIEINSGRHMRQAQPLVIDDVTQQQIVEVTPMARHIDNLLVAGNGMQTFGVLEFDTVVDPMPDPCQEALDGPYRRVRNVGGDLMCVLSCFAPLVRKTIRRF